ncbi:MAG TPA: hypothetical protein VGD43_21985, partial [Micromonospora sp.]
VRETELDRLVLDEGYRFLAHQLLDRADREQAYYAVAGIRHVMGRDGTAALSRQVVPALVDAVAARLLVRPRAADGAGGHRSRAVFALNAQACVTALLYVRRATCGEAGFRCAQVSATVGEDLVPELVDRCRAAVLRMLNVRHSWQDAQVQAWLRRHADTGIEGLKAGYLIVDPAGAPMAGVAEAVAAVRADFRWLTVILLTGLSVPDDEVLDSLGLGQVIVLRPELDEDDEFELGRTLEAFREMVHEEVV